MRPTSRGRDGTAARPTSRGSQSASCKTGRAKATPRGASVRQSARQVPAAALWDWAQAMMADMPTAESSDSRPATAPAAGPLPALKLKTNCQPERPSSSASTRSGTASTLQSARSTAAGATSGGLRGGTPAELELDAEAGTEKKVAAKPGSRPSRKGAVSITVQRPRSTPLRRQSAHFTEAHRAGPVTGSFRNESRCGVGPKPGASPCKDASTGLKVAQLKGAHGTTTPRGTKVRATSERTHRLQ